MSGGLYRVPVQVQLQRHNYHSTNRILLHLVKSDEVVLILDQRSCQMVSDGASDVIRER